MEHRGAQYVCGCEHRQAGSGRHFISVGRHFYQSTGRVRRRVGHFTTIPLPHFTTIETHVSFPGKGVPLIEVVAVARWAVLASALVARLAVDGAHGSSRFETWRQEQLLSRPARTRDCGLFDTECWVVNLDVGLHLLHETWLHTGAGLGREGAGVSRVAGMHVVIASGGRELSG